MTSLTESVAAVVARAEGLGVVPAQVANLERRLRNPLRIAIAGRLKAGKSTLLNALVGERLAATDAGECTRIVTWYREGNGYAVTAAIDGESRTVPFDRNGSLVIHLEGLDVARVQALTVEWPSRRLADYTLIDTVGLDAVRTDAAQGASTAAQQADVTLYLMRHLHVRDADFLEAFAIGDGGHRNAVAVLSRADEVGGGAADAMDTARAVAAEYTADDRIASRVQAVLPVAGLLAETSATLTEAEYRDLAEAADNDGDDSLASVDRFALAAGGDAEERRRHLLRRLGLFGVKCAVAAIRSGDAASASRLSALLRDLSGIEALVTLLRDRFDARAALLKAQSVLYDLRRLAQEENLTALLAEVERIEATAPELAELRLSRLLSSEGVDLQPEDGELAAKLAAGETLPAITTTDIVAAIDRWRRLTDDPLLDATTREAGEIVVRLLEARYSARSG